MVARNKGSFILMNYSSIWDSGNGAVVQLCPVALNLSEVGLDRWARRFGPVKH